MTAAAARRARPLRSGAKLRERLRVRRGSAVVAGQLATALVAVALVWLGIVLGLRAVGAIGVSTADLLTGYVAVFEALAALGPEDVDGIVRAFTGVAGVLAFLAFGWLALRQLPRPRLARGELVLNHDERGEVTVAPRAFERVTEGAAGEHPAVSGVSGVYAGDDVALQVAVTGAREAATTLRDVQRLVERSLRRHELPDVPVHVTITRFDHERKVQ